MDDGEAGTAINQKDSSADHGKSEITTSKVEKSESDSTDAINQIVNHEDEGHDKRKGVISFTGDRSEENLSEREENEALVRPKRIMIRAKIIND